MNAPRPEDFPDSPVPPGTGWPGDPATEQTPVARTAAAVARAATRARDLPDIDAQVSVCRACPRLVRWREDVARDKRRAYSGEPYWGRPVTGFGAYDARLVVIGLAPAAHGGNRTGRVFTGDRSGDWLFASMHRVGLATTPSSVHAADGQSLPATRLIAAVRCAPPDNRPTTTERDTCAPWLEAEMAALLPTLGAIVALGGYGWDAAIRTVRRLGGSVPRPKPRFGHGAEADLHTPAGSTVRLVGSYHPSQQNTFTGRLTEPMLDAVLARGKEVAGA